MGEEISFVIAKQSLKSDTIGINEREVQNEKSKRGFIHKMKYTPKEAHEKAYWLLLCKRSEGYVYCEELFKDCN